MASQSSLASASASASTLVTPSITTTTSAASDTFNFPREHAFPPFYTIQPNLTTRHAQLTKWSALVRAFCAHFRIYKLSVSNPAATASAPLFHNAQLDRRLSPADVREVLEFMRKDGLAELVGTSAGTGGGATKDGDLYWIYWRTPEEWAALLEGYVEETAQKGSVMTVWELTEGEATRGQEFHGMDPELLLKALGILVKRGKAQIFGQEDSQGVKFF